jgi:hypothetical protein
MPKRYPRKFSYHWKSPISYDSESCAKIMRKVLDELDYEFERSKTEKAYDKTWVVVPLLRISYAFRFNVSEPAEFTVDFYDTRPTHSSLMPYIEIDEVNNDNLEYIQKALSLMVKELPREPWKFTSKQRLMHGALMPEFRRAKKAWEKIGVKKKK